jgi:hypothetical protein
VHLASEFYAADPSPFGPPAAASRSPRRRRQRVTAIAACEFDRRDGAIIAATSDGGIHLAEYGIEAIRTGLSRLSQW